MSYNPYIVGNPIKGSSFVGREDLLHLLTQELWTPANLQSAVIYGHRRMGKTSLLMNAKDQPGNVVSVAFFNLQQLGDLSQGEAELFIALSYAICDALKIEPPEESRFASFPRQAFTRFLMLVRETIGKNHGLIIALDEFEHLEYLIKKEKISSETLGFLRAEAQKDSKTGFAFVGLHTLEEMTSDYWHPFFSSFIPIKVGFLDRKSVYQLLLNPTPDFEFSYTKDALERVYALTNGQPYLTQLIGFLLYHRFKEKNTPGRDKIFLREDVDDVALDLNFYRQGGYYFSGIWGQAGQDTEGQHIILCELATHFNGLSLNDLSQIMKLNENVIQEAIKTLLRHDVIQETNGKWFIAVELFRRWLLINQLNIEKTQLLDLFGKEQEISSQVNDSLEFNLKIYPMDDSYLIQIGIPDLGLEGESNTFIYPLSLRDLSDLRWYFEIYPSWPIGPDYDRAEEIETRIPEIGRTLFKAIIPTPYSMRLYNAFINSNCRHVLTIESTDIAILNLPWELLADKEGYLFNKKTPVSVLRRTKQAHKIKSGYFEPPVHVLMVISRPEGAEFIDPRSIATPLLDALEGIPEQVDVEFLRPPTLKALAQRLRDESKPRVHIVHYDGQGVYDKNKELSFLLFEDDEFQVDHVDAYRLGSLLSEGGVPLMVLNASLSAQPDERNPFASVAARLIESGVGGVVTMNYSVLVETAKRFTKKFYVGLACGQSVGTAIDKARRELLIDTKRLTIRRPDQEEDVVIHLQDWFLPALYQQTADLTPFALFPPLALENKSTIVSRGIETRLFSFPPPPLHGFHGRSRELLQLERIFATRHIIVLHGFGGQGKTALATQAADWFTRTHLFDNAVFVSFEYGASLDFVLNSLGNVLVKDNFAIYEGDKAQAIADALRTKPTLIIFDNFESALSTGNAPMPDLQILLEVAADWFTPGSLSSLLVTTRNPKIPHSAFAPAMNCLHLELGGLATNDALELAATILEAYSLMRPPRVALERLLEFLKGHPLSLQLAFPQLRTYSVDQLVEQYQSVLPAIIKDNVDERDESLLLSLGFSFDHLGEKAKKLLWRLGGFEGGAWEPVLLQITEIPEVDWQILKPQLIATALIRLEEIPGVAAPYIQFHPTLTPYLRTLEDGMLDGESKDAISERYWQVYFNLAHQLYNEDTQHPIEARAIVIREMPNFKRAIKLCLAAGALDETVEFTDAINKFLNYFGRWRERDELVAQLQKFSQDITQNSDLTRRHYLLESGRGERLLQQGRAGEAERVFRSLLERLEGDSAGEWDYEITETLNWIGRCLESQGKSMQAADCYRRAISLAQGMKRTQNVIILEAVAHTNLADVFATSGQYANARAEYETGLTLAKEMGDSRHQGVILGQLGTLALQQDDLREARRRYSDGLALFQRLGENQSEAIYWHQLGLVAQKASDWDEAERCYKEALQIRERIQDLPEIAKTSNQIAMLAQNAGRSQEAELWYMKAIEIDEKLGNPKKLALDYGNLAGLYLMQNRQDEAETYARRSLAIMETLDLSAEPWKTYAILAEIASIRGQRKEARSWRRKEQESFAAFAGSNAQIRQWQPVIRAVVRVCQGDEGAKPELESLLHQLEQTKDWDNLVNNIHKILDGERSESLFDGLDAVDALIVRRILQALKEDQSQDEQQGVTLPQLLEMVERAARGDKELGGQLFTAFQQMAREDDPTMSELGNALLHVLIGERNPDIGNMPSEVASAINGLLGRLKNVS